MSERFLSPREAADRLGVSVRALRLYERKGLVRARRTSAGWRVYGPEEVTRLHRVLTLKSLSLSLRRIAELLSGREPDLAALLALQEQALAARLGETQRALGSVRAARAKLSRQQRLSLDDLINLAREAAVTEQWKTSDVMDLFSDLDDAERSAMVGDLAALLREEYVDPDVGARAAAKIEQALEAGDYAACRRKADFATRLTADLDAVAHDKHLWVRSLLAEGPAGAAIRDSPREDEPINDSGVVRADRLAGDIGYLEIVNFPPAAFFKPTIDRAMGSLADARALVVDMRRNAGGDPQSVAYLVGFFAGGSAPVHVMDIIRRKPGAADYETEPTFTSATPAHFDGKPCCVLTSRRTFSAGEEFCYDMQAMKLAELVGETTGGGAHDGRYRIFCGLLVYLPTGRARSPITGANWEGAGVGPDVAAPSDQALRTALQQLGQSVTADAIDDLSLASLFRARHAALPDTEAALARLIDEHARGRVDFDGMTPEFAETARAAAARVHSMLVELGPVETVTFHGPWAGHGDLFDVRFAHGVQPWGVALAPDGKLAAAYCGSVEPR